MPTATIDVVEFLADLFAVPVERMELVLWGALIAGLAFATIHLITMLVTRWGDHEATAKSLIFSLIVHLSCALGLVASKPLRHNPAPEFEEPPPVEVRQLVVESDEEIERPESGNVPVWDQIAKPLDEQFARMDRERLDWEPPEPPDRRPEPPTPPDFTLTDLPDRPDEPPVVPELQNDAAAAGPRTAVAIPLEVMDETAEARPEPESPATLEARRRMARSGLQDEAELERDPRAGGIDRLDAEFTPDRQLAALNAPTDPQAVIERGANEAAVRRTGPAPVAMPADEAGVETNPSAEQTAGAASDPPRFSRTPARTPQSRDDGSPERFQPERTPQTASPEPERDRLAVRDGLDLRTDGPRLEPNLVRPNFDAVRTPNRTSVPSTYRLRNLEQRKETARKYGGTEESERAVEAGLAWLAAHQNVEGYWDADGFSANCPAGDRCTGPAGRMPHGDERRPLQDRLAGAKADAGVTALSVLAFLGAGYTHEEGRYADQVDRAIRWLIRQQHDDGFLGGEATYYARMYCHAMATFALAEAYGMQADVSTDQRLREPLARAVAYIVDQQNPDDGGWRYQKELKGDMSMFGWQLMALKSAEIGGLPIPRETKERMIQFLRDRSLGEHGGLAAYRHTEPPLPPTPAMTAEALFCKQMLGIQRTNPACTEAAEFLMQHLPKRSELNLYYWYYGTLAMYQHGGEPWREWNESLRDVLVAEQVRTGHAAGSWEPRGPWGPHGGRVYSTALSALCLEVYYRFLPLYQVGGQYVE